MLLGARTLLGALLAITTSNKVRYKEQRFLAPFPSSGRMSELGGEWIDKATIRRAKRRKREKKDLARRFPSGIGFEQRFWRRTDEAVVLSRQTEI